MHSSWSVCERGRIRHTGTYGVTIDNDHWCFPFPVHGNLTKSESTENNMMLAGIPLSVCEATWHRSGRCAVCDSFTDYKSNNGEVRDAK